MLAPLVYWLQWGLILWIGVLGLLVFKRIMTGEISSRGMLRTDDTDRFDPERLALLFATVGTALFYTVNAIGLSKDDLQIHGPDGGYWMPDIPQELLYLLFGAQTSFITGKFFRLTREKGK